MVRATKPTRQKSRIPNTIDGLLTRDDVNTVLQNVTKEQTRIKDLIVIYTDADGNHAWESSRGTLNSKAVWMLEVAKMDLLMGHFEED